MDQFPQRHVGVIYRIEFGGFQCVVSGCTRAKLIDEMENICRFKKVSNSIKAIELIQVLQSVLCVRSRSRSVALLSLSRATCRSVNRNFSRDQFTRKCCIWTKSPERLPKTRHNPGAMNLCKTTKITKTAPKQQTKKSTFTLNIQRTHQLFSLNICFDKKNVFRSANRQFIQDRIRHLVEAFSHRAQATRQRIELPATPSSSHETLDPTPIVSKPIKIFEEKPPESTPRVDVVEKTNVFFYLHQNFIKKEIDPQGKLYVIWMCVAAMAVLYNVFFIPLRSTFPYQTPNNRAAWMFFDYSADLIYILDMVLIQPRIMFLSEGFFVRDISITKKNYFKNAHFKVSHFLEVIFLILELKYVF